MEDGEDVEESELFKNLKQHHLIYGKIFLYLDHRTLHDCRQVCKEWNDFIQIEIWKLKKKHMIGLLNKNWKSQNFTKKSINLNNSDFDVVSHLLESAQIGTKASEEILLNIEKNKTAELVTLNDLIQDLEQDLMDNEFVDMVDFDMVDMSDKAIVATAGSLIKICDRDTKTVLYSGAPYGYDDSIVCARITHDFIVSGSSQGGLAAYTVHSDNNGVDLVYYNRSAMAEKLTHLDSDGVRVLVGTHVNMVLWDFSDRSAPVQVSSVDSGRVDCCVISYPHAFCTDLLCNQGLQVWNMVTRVKIR